MAYRIGLSEDDPLVRRIQRARSGLWGAVGVVTAANALLFSNEASGVMAILAAAAIFLPTLTLPVGRLQAGLRLDAIGTFVVWWVVGPVSGIGIVLPLVVAVSAILFERGTALGIAVIAVVAQAAQVPTHFIAKARDGDLVLFHPPPQVMIESEFVFGVTVSVATIILTAVVFNGIGEQIRRSRMRVQESEAAFRGAFNHAPVGVALIAHDGGILRSNHQLAAVLPTLASHGALQSLDGTSAEPICASLRGIIERGGGTDVVQVETAAGRTVEARISHVPAVQDSQLLAVLHVEDITERVANARRLEELIRSKDAFLQAMAHEIRTPLTGVLGFSDILADSDHLDRGTMRQMAAEIASSSAQIKSIVEDLVVIARSDIDRVTLLPTRVGLGWLVSRCLADSRDDRDVELLVPDIAVRADLFRVDQVIRNVIDNAYRHGGERIRITARTDGTMVVLAVSDDGRGVAAVDRDRIFEPYERAHEQETQPATVGLGLAVARGLARAMGGDLQLVDDEWTTFELTLPIDDSVVPSAEPVSN